MSNIPGQALLGQPIANLSFITTEDANVHLADLKGSIVVLYFYPKDSTPGCTIESKDFRDLYGKFLAMDAIILGISRDSLKSHHKFKEQCELPFPLISDEKEMLCHYFKVIKEKSIYGKTIFGIERSTFLIDRMGVLRQEWRNVKVAGHAQAVLEAVTALQ
jgi:peroxiredoxin Q/BCP